MSHGTDRREFLKHSVLTSAGASLAAKAATGKAAAAEPATALPRGRIGDLEVSRVLLGGNLLTHYTHSRDLRYVYNLTAKYNTPEKILETLAVAEENGINTLSIHVVPAALATLKKHRDRGGKMQWIVCPTAKITDDMAGYEKQVNQLVDDGTDAIYLWGVRGDQLTAQKRVDLIGKAVELAKKRGVPSGVGAHDLNVIKECEKAGIPADFYIKTLHHHKYPTGPKPEEITRPINEIPGYWCSNPEETVAFMKNVEKPWIAFKVMAAGAISPTSAFKYALAGGADFLLAGMFDFEIKDDVKVARGILARGVERERPWRA
jgi:hypothetical protein